MPSDWDDLDIKNLIDFYTKYGIKILENDNKYMS